jgi:hypothetical protein
MEIKKSIQKPEFTDPLKCGHCGNYAPMKRGARYSTIDRVYDENIGVSYDEGYTYEILECPSCSKINLISTYYNQTEDHEFPPSPEILFPLNDQIPIGLPISIEKAYEAAIKVKQIDANAYGVLAGRLLEMICEDRKAKGNDLSSKLSDLSTKGEIPENLVGVANGLRNFRNVGAHAVLGELTLDEVPILSSLTKAILEYVYSAPHLANIAEEKLDKLKKKKKNLS